MQSNWDEIKRLAADFQKAQIVSTNQKLSEVNCIEIVTLLIEKKLLEVVFTTDGKDYITPEHLEQQIKDELYLSGGRVNLVEISKNLNINLNRIEDISSRIEACNTDIHLLLGQLIHNDYIIFIAQEINEKLVQKGEISVSELAQSYDLPSDFVQNQIIAKHISKTIKGRQDPSNPQICFTQSYIQRCKSKIRGALSAIIRPTSISSILQQIHVREKIFYTLFDEIAPLGQLTSKQTHALYIPNIYAKMQYDYVNSFYKQNGFLDYDSINKLGISDPKQFIQKQLSKEELVFLTNCAIGSKIIDIAVVTSLNECNLTKSYVDLTTILPSMMSDQDIAEVFNSIMVQKGKVHGQFVYLDNIVLSQGFLNVIMEPCMEMAQDHAKTVLENGLYQKYLTDKLAEKSSHTTNNLSLESTPEIGKNEKRKKDKGKSGGSHGRETKTRSTKKNQRSNRVADNSDSEYDEYPDGPNRKYKRYFELIGINDVTQAIKKQLEIESLEHLSEAIAKIYYNQINDLVILKAKEMFDTLPQNNRRQTHSTVQEKLNSLLVDIRLYEKGLKVFSNDVQAQLVKYLLKSLGNDICNEIALYIANEHNLSIQCTNLNADLRNKIAQQCVDMEHRNVIIDLNKSLNKSIDEFVNTCETSMKTCAMVVKKVDKKKDRHLIIEHKEKLISQLRETTDSALLLHMVSLILFTTITGNILHASGKFVSNILSYIRPNLNAEQNQQLMDYYDLVLKVLNVNTDIVEITLINEKLNDKENTIKHIAMAFEKLSTSSLSPRNSISDIH